MEAENNEEKQGTGPLSAPPEPRSCSACDELRADRDLEKKLRKDAEHALCDAAELIEDIMRGKANPENEAEKWLRAYDPIRLDRSNTDGLTRPCTENAAGDVPLTVDANGALADAPLFAVFDRRERKLPSENASIEIWKNGEWLPCTWHPRTAESKADIGYIGTARTSRRPIQIGFHAWDQNESEFTRYRMLANEPVLAPKGPTLGAVEIMRRLYDKC